MTVQADPSAKADSVLAGWQALRGGLTREQFVLRYGHPFLLRRSPSAAPTQTREINESWAKQVSIATRVVDLRTLSPGGQGPDRLKGAQVVPLVKVEGNPFPDRISLGRASNCDVVIRDWSVSKLHAHVKVIGPDAAEIIDVKSSNGTRVNDMWLTPMEPERLGTGHTVVLGSVVMQFLDPGGLYDVL
jgi:hypothetical protein